MLWPKIKAKLLSGTATVQKFTIRGQDGRGADSPLPDRKLSKCHGLYECPVFRKIYTGDHIASPIHLSVFFFPFPRVVTGYRCQISYQCPADQSKKLLVESSVAIQEIAQKTGFASLVHFSRTYRNLMVSVSDTETHKGQ